MVKFPPLILEALSSNPGVGGSSPTLGRLKVPLSVIGGCVKIIKSKLMSVSSHYTRSRSVAKVLLPLCVGINLGKILRRLRPLRVFPWLIPPHSGVKSFTTSLHLCNVPLLFRMNKSSLGMARIDEAIPWDDCPYAKSNANTFVRACVYKVFPISCIENLRSLGAPRVPPG